MPRSIRIEYPGAFYHVMARGNRRESIFQSDGDRRLFLTTFGEACAKTGWRAHAWVLMGNHYHLVICAPEANLVAGMTWLQNTYTRRFNTRHKVWGRLFRDRYKAVLVEGSGYYYESLLDYAHLNPVRAGIIKPGKEQSVMDYPWSSVAGGEYISGSELDFRTFSDEQRSKREPADSQEQVARTETAQSPSQMDRAVEKCSLTPRKPAPSFS